MNLDLDQQFWQTGEEEAMHQEREVLLTEVEVLGEVEDLVRVPERTARGAKREGTMNLVDQPEVTVWESANEEHGER